MKRPHHSRRALVASATVAIVAASASDACGGRTELSVLDGAETTTDGGGSSMGGSGANPPAATGGWVTGGFGGAPPGCDVPLPGPTMVAIEDRDFCIDATEVTKADYLDWLYNEPTPNASDAQCGFNETYRPQNAGLWPPDESELLWPVGGVDWCDARDYCSWAGKRLCRRLDGGTDSYEDFDNSEWVIACTGDGEHIYAYGDLYEEGRCNHRENEIGHPVDVASLPCTDENMELFDMNGNVYEWVDGCSENAGEPLDGCLARGGSYFWFGYAPSEACHQGLGIVKQNNSGDVGFRCCRDAG